MEIRVQIHSLAWVMSASLRDWEQRQVERGRHDYNAADAPDGVRERWAVNFVRHRLTEYDRLLEEQAGKVGVNAAVVLIRRRILAAIAAAYPDLADEVSRQIARS